ncbi:MAG: hypothetical protein OEZ47_09460 [Gammaproteobacteria bacterium]|nr:hypothetical protein [Gammaproteobacteria bacterium]
MRYVVLILAYAVLGLLVGLGFLFPQRPTDPLDFFVISAALIPVLGIFDFIGQSIIDNEWLKKGPGGVRLIIGLIVLGVFLWCVKLLLGFLDLPTIPWEM